MQKSFPATLDNLKNIRLFLTSFLKDHNVEDIIINQIELGVDEAVSNIIKHSYKGESKDKEINIKLEISKKKYLFIYLIMETQQIQKKLNLEILKK